MVISAKYQLAFAFDLSLVNDNNKIECSIINYNTFSMILPRDAMSNYDLTVLNINWSFQNSRTLTYSLHRLMFLPRKSYGSQLRTNPEERKCRAQLIEYWTLRPLNIDYDTFSIIRRYLHITDIICLIPKKMSLIPRTLSQGVSA